eukprot:170967-Chlamydomonas_euryale.AAC.1
MDTSVSARLTVRRLRLRLRMNSNELLTRSMPLALSGMERTRIAIARSSLAPLPYSNHHLCAGSA